MPSRKRASVAAGTADVALSDCVTSADVIALEFLAPTTLQELGAWPDRMFSRFMDMCPSQREVLQDFVRHPINLHTEYTGKLGVEVACNMLFLAWQRAATISLPTKTFHCISGCILNTHTHTRQ